MFDNGNVNNSSDVSERWQSPSDRIKEMILRRWEKTENAYSEGNDDLFIRSSKSLIRSLWVFLNPKEKEMMEKIKKDEFDKISNIREDKSISNELKKEKIRELEFNYAIKRMEISSELINNSSIIVKEIEIDFMIPEDPEEVKRLQDIISEATPMEDKPIKFR